MAVNAFSFVARTAEVTLKEDEKLQKRLSQTQICAECKEIYVFAEDGFCGCYLHCKRCFLRLHTCQGCDKRFKTVQRRGTVLDCKGLTILPCQNMACVVAQKRIRIEKLQKDESCHNHECELCGITFYCDDGLSKFADDENDDNYGRVLSDSYFKLCDRCSLK